MKVYLAYARLRGVIPSKSMGVRSQKEYETIEDEVTALLDRKTFRQVWKAATSEPYSFLTIFLDGKTLNETFMVRFEHWITFPESEESD